MRYVCSIFTATLLASAVGACSSEPTYSRYPAYQASTPNGYYYANSPARQGYYPNIRD